MRVPYFRQVGWVALVVLLPTAARAADDAAPRVILKSGRVFEGFVVGERKVQGSKLLRIETDMGEILVPAREVRRQVKPKPQDDATFAVRNIQIIAIKGTVERRPAGAEAWQRVSWKDPYDGWIVNEANAIVQPGDEVRTGPNATLDLTMHTKAWMRIAPGSHVHFPVEPKADEASVDVRSGASTFAVRGRPRGQVFRVRTPLTLLSSESTTKRVTVEKGRTLVEVKDGYATLPDGRRVKAGHWAIITPQGIGLPPGSTGFSTPPRMRPVLMAYVPKGRYSIGLGKAPDPTKVRNVPLAFATSYGTGQNAKSGATTRVEVAEFLIDVHEVTNESLLTWMDALGRKDAALVRSRIKSGETLEHAAHSLKFDDAQALARWLGRRLPSETQWEVAARGRKFTVMPWGNKYTKAHEARVLHGYTTHGVPGSSTFLMHASGWKRPDAMPTVSEPTLDESSFGVRFLVSGPPEWTRSMGKDPPHAPLSNRHMRADQHVSRGKCGSTRLRASELSGVRCVIELSDE